MPSSRFRNGTTMPLFRRRERGYLPRGWCLDPSLQCCEEDKMWRPRPEITKFGNRSRWVLPG